MRTMMWTVAKSSSRRVLVSILATLSGLSTLGAQSASGPVSYSMSTSVDSGGGRAPARSITRVRFANGVVRVESASGQVLGTGGPYMLVVAGSDTFTTVMPEQRMAMTGLNPLIELGTSRLVTLELVGEPSYRVEELGDGPTILGRPTKRFRETLDYTLSATLGGERCSTRIRTSTESWRARGTVLPDAALHFLSGPLTNSSVTGKGMEKLRALVTRQPTGLPLRMESVDHDGVRTRVEVVELGTAPIDSAVFRVPVDYQRVERPALRSMMDSTAMHDMVVGALRKKVCR